MSSKAPVGFVAWWLLTGALFVAAEVMVIFHTPEEATMGQVQKLFYLHMPSAISTFLAALLCFVASIAYLAQRHSRWDDLAAAGAKVSVLFCSVVLLTGMIWGKVAWGHWWTWSPRLTFSLVLWLLYVVYLMIRASIESSQRRALVSAVYGIIAFLDVPLVYLSVKLMRDIHPRDIELDPEMKRTLLFCFLPVLMLAGGLVARLYHAHRQRRARSEALAAA